MTKPIDPELLEAMAQHRTWAALPLVVLRWAQHFLLHAVPTRTAVEVAAVMASPF